MRASCGGRSVARRRLLRNMVVRVVPPLAFAHPPGPSGSLRFAAYWTSMLEERRCIVKYDEVVGSHTGRTSSIASRSANVGLLLLPQCHEYRHFIRISYTAYKHVFDAPDNIECKPHLRVLLVLQLHYKRLAAALHFVYTLLMHMTTKFRRNARS